MKKDIVALGLRLPSDIHAQLGRYASDNYISLNAAMVQILAKAMKEAGYDK